jgi:hypothetical protein
MFPHPKFKRTAKVDEMAKKQKCIQKKTENILN